MKAEADLGFKPRQSCFRHARFAEAVDPQFNIFLALEWEDFSNFFNRHVRKIFEQRVSGSLSLVGTI